MLTNIDEPGFEYFLKTPCRDWDAVQYHKAWKDSNLCLDKANVTRSFNKQLRIIKEQGTEEEKKNAIRLENQFRVESRKMGLIYNFWLKPDNFTESENIIKPENLFLSCELSCDGVQFGDVINTIHKRDYKKHEQLSIERISATLTKRTKLDEKFNATESSSELLLSTNVQQTSTISNSNVKTEELEDDEEIKIDLVNVSIELNREPTVKWEIGCINITDRFRQYQKDVFQKAVRQGLKYDNIYELLALSSIIVLCWPCPYPMFTDQEWKEITKTNPYTISESPIPPEISSSLRDIASRQLVGEDVFMDCGNAELNRKIALMFNNLYYSIPEVAPSKLSEEEHWDMFIYPITHLFRGSKKEYELRLNRANVNSKTKPDLSCIVNDVAILNSEFKPLGCTPLQQKKDRLKVQLKARKSIDQQLQSKGGPGESGMFLNMGDSMESFFMDLKYDGLYRSWPFLTTKLVVDKATIPLAEFAISHLVALEERVEKIAMNFKYRSSHLHRCPLCANFQILHK